MILLQRHLTVSCVIYKQLHLNKHFGNVINQKLLIICEGICVNLGLTQYVEVLQRGAAGGQLVYIWVTDSAVGGEEEFAQAGQAAGEVLETSGAALQCGTPAQVQLLQHSEWAQTNWIIHTFEKTLSLLWVSTATRLRGFCSYTIKAGINAYMPCL